MVDKNKLKIKVKILPAVNKKYDLEDRFVKFAGDILLFLNDIPNNYTSDTLKKQLTRSATSSALNFGEYQGAESTKDSIHKLSIALKELKETRTGLKILQYVKYGNNEVRQSLLTESDELAAIVATIIKNKK